MDKRIIELEKYKRDIENKKDIDNNDITLEELSIDELESITKLYKDEIKYLSEDIKARVKNIAILEKNNKILRKMLGKGDK